RSEAATTCRHGSPTVNGSMAVRAGPPLSWRWRRNPTPTAAPRAATTRNSTTTARASTAATVPLHLVSLRAPPAGYSRPGPGGPDRRRVALSRRSRRRGGPLLAAVVAALLVGTTAHAATIDPNRDPAEQRADVRAQRAELAA